jgi:hypothetical protein
VSGVFVYASKVGDNATEVRYAVRRDHPDAPVDGVLVISTSGPENAWSVEGDGASRSLAGLVVARAVRLHQERGVWPERVAKQ